jgi:hypothetical protein
LCTGFPSPLWYSKHWYHIQSCFCFIFNSFILLDNFCQHIKWWSISHLKRNLSPDTMFLFQRLLISLVHLDQNFLDEMLTLFSPTLLNVSFFDCFPLLWTFCLQFYSFSLCNSIQYHPFRLHFFSDKSLPPASSRNFRLIYQIVYLTF